MITIGLDFGTHQTKICVENKDGVELSYSFIKFNDEKNKPQYTLPSIIGVGNNGLLSYGYLPSNYKGEIIRYFKQIAFSSEANNNGMSQKDAIYYSIWYIAYIVFDLEKQYGEFPMQMGVPTDSSPNRLTIAKRIATSIIASAYNLVENIFEHDKQMFLETDIDKLREITEVIEYSDEVKEMCGLLVFPEAYACLMPIIEQKKIDTGINLMIDIGGGTTDISFFTIENHKAQVYDYTSVNMGLNYLTRADEKLNSSENIHNKERQHITPERFNSYRDKIENKCKRLHDNLLRELLKQTNASASSFWDKVKRSPIIFCGGGSTYESLQINYVYHKDKKVISEKEWNTKVVENMDEIIKLNLCSILFTAYGLAIHKKDDKIQMKLLRDVFEHSRTEKKKKNKKNKKSNFTPLRFGSANGGMDYYLDYDSWK